MSGLLSGSRTYAASRYLTNRPTDWGSLQQDVGCLSRKADVTFRLTGAMEFLRGPIQEDSHESRERCLSAPNRRRKSAKVFWTVELFKPSILTPCESEGRSQGEQCSDREPPPSRSHVSQPRTTVITRQRVPRSIETRNKIQDSRRSSVERDKEETVLRAFGGKRPRKETLLVALAWRSKPGALFRSVSPGRGRRKQRAGIGRYPSCETAIAAHRLA